MNDEYEDVVVKNESPLSKLIKWTLSIILIVLLIILIVWLVNGKNATNNGNNNNNNDLNPLLVQIFNNNIETMKNAAIDYYTVDKVPSKEGQTLKMTLEDMLKLKLLLPLVDKNGQACSATKSYTEITKVGSKYQLKVNLSCGSQEDYIMVYIGCYNYCANYVCEEKTTTETKPEEKVYNPNCSLKVTSGTLGTSNRYTSDVIIGFNSKTAGSKATLTGAGIGTEINYSNNSYTVSKDGTYTVYGYVKDSNGKTATCAIKVTKYTPSTVEYEYLYEKKVARTYSDWSDWSANKLYTASDNIIWGKQELVNNEKNGATKVTQTTYKNDISQPIWQITNDRVVGTYLDYVCDSYTYYRTSGTTYQVTGDWKYSHTIYNASSIPDWTNTTKYEEVAVNYDVCKEDCVSKPVYTMKVYVRTIAAKTENKDELSAKCNVTAKEITVYGTSSKAVTFKQQIASQTVTYKPLYHTQTRTVLKEAYTDQKWSNSSNDKNLLNSGYTYTGTKRAK